MKGRTWHAAITLLPHRTAFESRLPRPAVVGHRGAPRHAPENTFVSFDLALAGGADGLELDVRWTADRVLVVIHDATLERTTSGRGPVAAVTAAVLANLRCRAADGSPAPEVRVPTLAATLARYGPQTQLFIELKADGVDDARGLGRAVGEMLTASAPSQPAVVMSFHAPMLEAARAAAPQVECCVLCEAADLLSARQREAKLGQARDLAATYVGLPDRAVTAEFAAQAHRWTLQLITWPNLVDDLIRAGIRSGVDVLESDDPARLRRCLASLARR